MANALDDLKRQIEEAIEDAKVDLVRLEELGPTMDRPEKVEEAVKMNLNMATSQSKVFRTTLRQFALRKVEVEGAMVLMLKPQEKEAYKKFNKVSDIKALQDRLTKAMEVALSSRAELFGAGGEALTNAEDDDADVESGNLSAKQVWNKTDQVQDRTLTTVQKAQQVANETMDIADSATREQQRQLELTHKTIDEVQELSQRYGISFSIMGTILRQIACDGCFQALFALLILAIIAFLIVKFT
eukprot:TRINITY_DN3924_c0_g1_i5.p1 TRINITY_DN3924_c0_g1~~TRINITY_DN3924_c0_g1_i5.p1  ORF type:complete len:243 (-),score=66.39 TRINITY_DN3924_c0_g1_i5:300-1028(-)